MPPLTVVFAVFYSKYVIATNPLLESEEILLFIDISCTLATFDLGLDKEQR